MSDATRAGLRVMAAALLLGVLGDALLRVTPWGINTPLWVAALVAAALAVKPRDRRQLWLLGVAVLFAAGLAWRDAWPLAVMNITAALVALGLALPGLEGKSLQRAGFLDYLLDLLLSAARTVPGIIPVAASDIRWNEIPRGGRSETALAVGRGLLLAIPVLLVFGALLTAADAIFQDIVSRLFDWDVAQMWSHLFVFGLVAWVAGGYLRAMAVQPMRFFGPPVPTTPPSTGDLPWTSGLPSLHTDADAGPAPSTSPSATATLTRQEPATERIGPRIFLIEGATVLACLDLLFLAFVIVQVHYLFGGGTYFAATAGLTYAEYARRGFFELITVAGLCLPLLLAAHTAMRSENRAHRRLFAVLSGLMVLLLFGIIASALKRMDLYVNAYGLTQLRVYTTACMLWLGVVFAWFLVTVSAGRRAPFAFGAMLAAAASLLALNVVNPDGLIVRVNTSRPNAATGLDAEYLTRLSADAIPPLVERMPGLPQGTQYGLALILKARTIPTGDWRTWNAGRSSARAALRAHDGALSASIQTYRRQKEQQRAEQATRKQAAWKKLGQQERQQRTQGTAPKPADGPR